MTGCMRHMALVRTVNGHTGVWFAVGPKESLNLDADVPPGDVGALVCLYACTKLVTLYKSSLV